MKPTNAPSANHNDLLDYASAIQYIESLNIHNEEQARHLVHILKLERASINTQIATRSAEMKNKDSYAYDFREWLKRARKALKVKNDQLRWIKEYCIPALEAKKEESVWKTCIVLSDYILGLPESVSVPKEILGKISEFKQGLQKKQLNEK